MAGVWAGVSASSAPATSASDLGAVSRTAAPVLRTPAGPGPSLAISPAAAPAHAVTAHAATIHVAPVQAAPVHAIPARPPHRAVRVRLAAGHPSQHTAARHPATALRPATVQQLGTVAHPAAARHATAKPNGAARHVAAAAHRHEAVLALHQAPAQPTKPYLIYDSVTPAAIPPNQVVATYATGSYAASPSQVAGQKRVLWIDTNGSDPNATVLDVEPGDATPSMAATWAASRLTAHPNAHAVIYTMQSQWPAAQQAIATLPSWMQSHIRWWIADPTGVPHIVPGSDATQWYWGQSYDMTTATPRF